MKLLLVDDEEKVVDAFFDIELLNLDDPEIRAIIAQWIQEATNYSVASDLMEHYEED